jgi:O-antigen/teichoic acid export membrane protein
VSRTGPSICPRSDLRVLIGLTEVAGYASNLRAGLHELGVFAEVLDLQPGAFEFGDDTPATRLARGLQRVSRARLASRLGSVRRRALAAAQILLTPFVLVQALRRYNTFVFLFDTSFLRQRELPLLRLLRKRIVYVFCGSDDRPTYLDGGLMGSSHVPTIDACIASVRKKKRMLRRVERYADVILTNPAHGILHERAFVSFPMVGIPRVVDGEPVTAPGKSRPPRIVHAPSHPAAKGTDVIRATLGRLREQGYSFEYDEVQGVPNSVLRQRLRDCDFVVDQVWGNTPMGGLAADAALVGKPTVVSGYAWDELRQLLPEEAFPPSELCRPDELDEAIARLLTDDEHRRELGARARAFVTRRWSAPAVAERLLDLLDGPPPADWVHEPSELRYVLGWGQPAERSAELVDAVVERSGAAALGLGDKPEAEARVLALAGRQPAPAPTDGEPKGMRSLLSDSVVYGLGVAMLPVCLLLVTPVIARKLGPAGFGAIDLLTTILTLATVVAMLGLDSGLSRSYFDRSRAEPLDRRTAVTTVLVTVLTAATALAIVLALAGSLFAELLKSGARTTSITTIVAAFAVLPLACGVLITRVVLRLERRRRRYVFVTMVQAVVGVGVAATLVALGAGATGYFAGLAVGALAALLYSLTSGTFFAAGAKISRADLRTMLSYGLPLVPSALATWVTFAIDRTLLASMRGLPEVGYYAIASKLAAPLFMALNAFAIAWIPFILAQPAKRQLELRARAVTAVACAVGIGFILLLLLAPDVVGLLGGPKFHRSLRAVPGVALGWLAWGIAFVLATEFMVSRRTRVVALATASAAGANVLLNVILIPPFGFVGAAWATAATFVLLAAIYFVIERRTAPAPYRFGRLLLIGLVLAASVGVLGPQSLALSERLPAALAAIAALAVIAGTDRGRDRSPRTAVAPRAS